MAGSGVGSGGVVTNQVDQQITALNQQASREGHGNRDKRFLQLTCPHILDIYKPDDFISDEMSSYGSVDFESSATSSRKEPEAEPAVISRRKERARIRRRRSKVLKAAVKSLAAQALSFQATEMLKLERKESSSSAVGGPECKKPECSGDSPNNMEAAEMPETLLTISNAEAEEQSIVVNRETLNEEQSGPESAHDHVTNRTEQQDEHVNPPDGAQEEPRCPENPEMKITVQRIDFVCSVCKFHSFYKEKFAAHLESEFHKDHFRFLSEHLPKTTVDFLQLYFGNKHKKVEDFVDQIPDHRAAVCQLYEDRDRTQGIGMEHFMRKVEAAHCLACDSCFPMQHSLLQSHLRSPHHKHKCKLMMEESKNSGLAYARRILSRSSLRKNLRLYRK
ncbi:A-kinase anchor protein 8-like isoform X1, partial [Clarias magur]